MLSKINILDKISAKKNVHSGKQVLFENSYIRIIHQHDYLEMECLGERRIDKRDVSAIALFFRKYCRLTGNTKLLLFLSKIWRLDMDAWDFITKKGFFGHYTVAFISSELHQGLLLKKLEKLNQHLKLFKTKELAIEWLEGKK